MDGGGYHEAGWFERIAAATAFLTRIAIRATPFRLADAMDMFPLIGAVVGGVVGVVYFCAIWLNAAPLLAAILAVTSGFFLTGALHEDGLADMADGLAGGDRERRLAIMRDSRIGTYGVLALLAAMGAKVAALSELPALPAIALLAASGGASRAAIVWLMATTRPARADGLAATAGQPSRFITNHALIGGMAGAALLIGLVASILAAIVALAAGGLVAWLVRRRAMRLFGGQTGDVCGAMQVLTEVAMLVAMALTIP
jgi:adenosylcobinamide-GDP ribazoletransferase